MFAEQLARLAAGLDTVETLANGVQTMRAEIQALMRKVEALLATKTAAGTSSLSPASSAAAADHGDGPPDAKPADDHTPLSQGTRDA